MSPARFADRLCLNKKHHPKKLDRLLMDLHVGRTAMKHFMIIFMLLLPLMVMCDADARTKTNAKLKPDTPSYNVVAEYIRSLGAIHNVQLTASKEQGDVDNDNPTQTLMNEIRNGTRLKYELRESIGMLKIMTIKRKSFDELIPNTIYFYQEKLKLYDEMTGIAKQLIEGPKPGVDYSKLAARMPEITASVEYLDKGIFQSMVMVFALLIDEKPDSEGHMSHLNITKAQRQKLIDAIDASFADSLDKENKNWTVASADLLKTYLQKDYKCLDEWQ